MRLEADNNNGLTPMLRTIEIGNYQLVQGEFIKDAGQGRIAVGVYGSVYVGLPVNPFQRGAERAVSNPPTGNEVLLAG